MNFSYVSLDPVQVTKPDQNSSDSSRTFQGIPSIERIPSGRLFAVWYSGGAGEGYDNYALLKISDDNGISWSETVAVVNPPHPVRAFDPEIWFAPNGKLYWFWAQGCGGAANVEIFDGIAGVWYSILENPEADPADFKFTPSRRISNGIMMNKPTVLKNGSWALPCSIWSGDYLKHDSLGIVPGAYMVVSEDQGETFYVKGRVDASTLSKNFSFDEHIFIERENGDICCYFRYAEGIAEFVSSDGGKSWSDAVVSQSLNSPSSRFFIKRLASGRLLAVINNSKEQREKMTAFLSEDDGKSWKHSLLLDARIITSYPDGFENNGTITVIYDKDRYKGGYILMAQFTEDEIIAGTLQHPESFLTREISHSRPVEK